MTAVDWVIVGFACVLAFYGYSQGFIVGVLSLGGFILGAFLGARLGPLVLSAGHRSPYAPLFGLGGALLLGALLAGGLESIGSRVRMVLRIPGLRAIDGLMGAALTACVALGIAWMVSAVALDSSGSASVSADIRGSTILRALDEMLPPSGPILDALARFDPLPSVPGPAPDVPAPTRRILAHAAVGAAGSSVVRVFGIACGLGVEGSGWVVARGLVATNAHVVAGESQTTVQVGGVGPDLSARAVLFDARNDVAILRVRGLSLRALSMASRPRSGSAAAILGYPRDGPFDAQPGRLGQTETVYTENAYGRGRVLRTITALRGLVRPGNSGGPLVDSRGRVLATVFAALTGPGRAGGFAVPDEIVRADLRHARADAHAVATGGCAE
ncbi:MAG: MarP family serine protease [Solirubrobacteraceae bacterium]